MPIFHADVCSVFARSPTGATARPARLQAQPDRPGGELARRPQQVLGPVPAQRPAAGHDLPGERRRLRRHRRRLPRRHAAGYLSDDQLDDYQPWFDNHQRLRELVSELETLSQAIADADPRWNRRPAAPTGRTVQNSA
jgi:hypothetical protein